MNLYIASPRAEYHVAHILAAACMSAGHRIVSTWHTLPDLDGLDGSSTETTSTAHRRELLDRCRADIRRAEVMIAWMAAGQPRMTIAEMAIMLEVLHRPVIWIQGRGGEGGNILDSHPLVAIVQSTGESTMDDVLAALRRIEELEAAQ